MRVSTSPPASASSSRREPEPSSQRASPSPFRRGTPASYSRARASPLLNTDSEQPFGVEPGMRIAQLVVVPVAELELLEVEELPATERGVRGFGSSA